MSDSPLSCNFPKCKAAITHQGPAKLTRCSHIFCDIHQFNDTGFNKKCPACGSILKGDCDIIDSNLHLPEELKSKLLCGLQPEMIFDVMSRGLQFWSVQMQNRTMRYRINIEYFRSQLASKDGYLEKMELDIKQYIEMQGKKVEYLKKEVKLANDALQNVENQLEEKSRQLFNLQARYDALRRQSVSSIMVNEPEPMEQEAVNMNPYRPVRSEAFNRNRAPAPPTPVFEFRPNTTRHNSFLQGQATFPASAERRPCS